MREVSESDWLGDVEPVRNVGGRPAKGHTGRQRKIHCERCRVILYGSRAALERSGLPFCGCGERMVIANFRDREALGDPEALEYAERAEAEQLERQARARVSKFDRGGRPDPKRCEVPQCFRFARGRFCADHAQDTWRIAS